MTHGLIGITIIGGLLWIFVLGLRAARTRKLAMLGMVPAGCSLGAFVWIAMSPEVETVMRIAQSLAALSAGFAHAVAFSLVALPARRVWLRLLFVPVGLWAGTFASLWFVLPYSGLAVKMSFGLLGAATLTAWIMLPFYTKDRGWMWRGKNRVPSVRFPCPRCGTRVDWGQGVGSCTDCGLFVHILWPADEMQARRAENPVKVVVQAPRGMVRFSCPGCERVGDWPHGDNACPACGLKVSIHWNEHVKV